MAFVDKNNHDTLQPLVQALEKVAGRKQSTVTGIAQAYVMAKVGEKKKWREESGEKKVVERRHRYAAKE